MKLNNDQFGKADYLTKPIFNQYWEGEGINPPPPGSNLRITDSAQIRITDNLIERITD